MGSRGTPCVPAGPCGFTWEFPEATAVPTGARGNPARGSYGVWIPAVSAESRGSPSELQRELII